MAPESLSRESQSAPSSLFSPSLSNQASRAPPSKKRSRTNTAGDMSLPSISSVVVTDPPSSSTPRQLPNKSALEYDNEYDEYDNDDNDTVDPALRLRHAKRTSRCA